MSKDYNCKRRCKEREWDRHADQQYNDQDDYRDKYYIHAYTPFASLRSLPEAIFFLLYFPINILTSS